ncbi:MAG TPA: hypothetical protein VMA32_00350 [Streptosporangiaceae bacterium]|nr:hypothetical protein [Streptosporangiaceae bacterium]
MISRASAVPGPRSQAAGAAERLLVEDVGVGIVSEFGWILGARP